MKVTVIGGGSYNWVFGFTRQFVHSQYLSDINLVLMDHNPEALELVGGAAEHYNRAHGSPLRIEKTNDLDASLEGADYVLVSISTGGLEAMRHDLEIPEKYGIYHTVGDSVGPGGWMRAVRNIPVFNDLGARMVRLCPEAWLINVSNPLSVLTRVPERNYRIKTIGMCPAVEDTGRALARLIGAAPDSRLDYVVTGINHGSWFINLFADGLDVLQRLKEMGCYRSDDRIPSQVHLEDFLGEMGGFRAALAIWREIGYLPAIGDRHIVENWPWFIVSQDGAIPFGIQRTPISQRKRWMKEKHDKLAHYAQTGNEAVLGDLGHGDDPICEVVEALSGYRSFLYTTDYVNIGQITGLPEEAVVETRCLFDAAGVHPLASPLPDLLKPLVLPHVLRQEAIIDIALHGTFNELTALVLTDPLCSRLLMGQCRSMIKEMLLANQSLIQNPRLLEFDID
jgi:alpha-galactosidase/6-phospho-beta-glucosidase family protein